MILQKPSLNLHKSALSKWPMALTLTLATAATFSIRSHAQSAGSVSPSVLAPPGESPKSSDENSQQNADATSPSNPSADRTAEGPATEVTLKDPRVIKLALKYVVYTDGAGKPVINQETTDRVTAAINQLYAPCKIQFIAERYQAVQPQKLGLEFNTSSMNELDPIRTQFAEPNRLVVINTGEWNHSTMGAANAWTAMPGASAAGVVIEASAASFAGIVAHELGHYLSLDHLNDTSNVMDPVIYDSSTRFDGWQCEEMRQTAYSNWNSMVRLARPSQGILTAMIFHAGGLKGSSGVKNHDHVKNSQRL